MVKEQIQFIGSNEFPGPVLMARVVHCFPETTTLTILAPTCLQCSKMEKNIKASSIPSLGYCLYGVLHVVSMGFLQVLCFPPTSEKHACRWIGYANLSQGLDVSLQYAGITSMVYSHLTLSVPDIISDCTTNQDQVLTENE